MRVSALIQRATNVLKTAEDLPPTSVTWIWLWQRHTESFKPSAVSMSSHLDKRRKAQVWTSSCLCSKKCSWQATQENTYFTQTGDGVSRQMAYAFQLNVLMKSYKMRNNCGSFSNQRNLLKKSVNQYPLLRRIFRTGFQKQHFKLSPEGLKYLRLIIPTKLKSTACAWTYHSKFYTPSPLPPVDPGHLG